MKFIIPLLFLLLQINTATAQVSLPPLSPEGILTQQVGYTKMSLQYGRPSARGRKIMGELVPFGKLWRTGAGKCTTLSFDQPVTIANKTIPAGIYAVLSIPDTSEWIVLLNSDTRKAYGDPSEYDAASEVIRFKVNPQKTARFYESLTFDIDVVNNDGMLYLSWENTQIQFSIATNSDAEALQRIHQALKDHPHDPEVFSTATHYYYWNNKSMEDALRFIDKALTLKEDRWYYRQKVNVLIRLGNFKEARKTAEAAIAFLQRSKPIEWEESIKSYQDFIKK